MKGSLKLAFMGLAPDYDAVRATTRLHPCQSFDDLAVSAKDGLADTAKVLPRQFSDAGDQLVDRQWYSWAFSGLLTFLQARSCVGRTTCGGTGRLQPELM